MADIYKAKDSDSKKTAKTGPITDTGKTVQAGEENYYKNPLKAFFFMPAKFCFETKDRKEQIVLMVRKHPITNLPWFLMAVILSVLPKLFVFVPTIADLPADYRFVLGAVWYLIVIAYILESFLNWFYDVNIVTDERVVDIDFNNLIYKKVSDAKLDKIEDITYTQGGVIRTLFDYGNVFIQTAAEVPAFDFLAVPKPDRVVAILRDMIMEEEQETLEGRVR